MTTCFPLGGIPMSSPVCLPLTETCAATFRNELLYADP